MGCQHLFYLLSPHRALTTIPMKPDTVLRDLAELIKAQRRYAGLLDRCRKQAPALVRAICYELRLSQRQLAKRLGVHHTYLSMVQNGKRPPGFELLQRLHGLLGNRDGAEVRHAWAQASLR